MAQSSTSSCDGGDDDDREDDAEAVEDYEDFKKWMDAKNPPETVTDQTPAEPPAASKPPKFQKCKYCSGDSTTCNSSQLGAKWHFSSGKQKAIIAIA